MKKLLISLAIGFIVLNVKANHSSVLNLKMFDNGIFSVVLDERPSHSQSGFFSADHVKPGYHKLKVVRYSNNPYSYYPIKQVVYKGWINIPPRSVVFASINCHNQFDIVKIEPKFCHPSGGGHGHGNGHGHSNSNACNDDCGTEGNDWAVPPPLMPLCMSAPAFVQLKNSISSVDFDNSRFEIARQALSLNYFTSAQVADLARMFSFETSRLEFSKLAFAKTIDKRNYFLVNESFTFASSIAELNEFIIRGQ